MGVWDHRGQSSFEQFIIDTDRRNGIRGFVLDASVGCLRKVIGQTDEQSCAYFP